MSCVVLHMLFQSLSLNFFIFKMGKVYKLYPSNSKPPDSTLWTLWKHCAYGSHSSINKNINLSDALPPRMQIRGFTVISCSIKATHKKAQVVKFWVIDDNSVEGNNTKIPSKTPNLRKTYYEYVQARFQNLPSKCLPWARSTARRPDMQSVKGQPFEFALVQSTTFLRSQCCPFRTSGPASQAGRHYVSDKVHAER